MIKKIIGWILVSPLIVITFIAVCGLIELLLKDRGVQIAVLFAISITAGVVLLNYEKGEK